MKLLALDQASRTTGYAVFDNQELIANGTFTLTADDIGERLVTYRKKIETLIEKYDVDEVAFEDIQMQTQVNNVQTFKVLAEIFGVTQEYLAEHKHSYQIVSSNTWKSKLGIKGKKREEQKKNAQEYVLTHYNQKVSSDAADAICIGASIVLEKTSVFNWS